MKKMIPIKAYLIRAYYDWIVDNESSPYLLIDATLPCIEVPQEYVSDGRIVLDISPTACRGLEIEDDRIFFEARFNGVRREILVHPAAVLAIYCNENKRGMEFGSEYNLEYSQQELESWQGVPSSAAKPKGKKPFLRLVDTDD